MHNMKFTILTMLHPPDILPIFITCLLHDRQCSEGGDEFEPQEDSGASFLTNRLSQSFCLFHPDSVFYILYLSPEN